MPDSPIYTRPAEILQKSLMIVDDPDVMKKALKAFEKSGSLTKTLHQLDIMIVDNGI